jgi:bifunctional non-homologous end joining protein LigD
MGLTTYKKKRSFNKTPEPTGGRASGKELTFVIQKHDASRLHYDFRLEMKGVLKSWAVPKGPSTDPSVKRLAMMVEDHPYDYKDFEGIIPKGQYGGGTVIVWDEGTYEAVDSDDRTKKFDDKKKMESYLLSQIHKGKLHFNLHGQKLKGEYALVKSSYQGENSWLLMKIKDKYAKATDITKKEKSVLSGKTIKQIAKDPGNVWQSNNQVKKTKDTAPVKEKAVSLKKKAPAKTLMRKQKFPSFISPMLATLVDKPFDEEGWVYEIKWDGYRAVAYLNKGKVHITSRNNKSFTERFYPIQHALQELKIDAVLDGEIIVAGEEGVSNFGHLQNWRSEADGELKYYVFDLLWLNGYSLMDLPLTERREKLKEVIPDHPMIHISEIFESTGMEFFEVARKMNLEGIMAKKADSLYTPGIRTKEWLKIKVSKRHEVVIGGYTRNEGTSKYFSSLLVGVYEGNKLRYTGKIGTGFGDKLQKEMMQKFKKLETNKNPFDIEPDVNKPSRFRPNPPKATVTWLKPSLVCEVSYTEITSDGVMRHPSFEGMRDDKKAKDVKEEQPKSTKAIVKKTDSVLHKEKIIRGSANKELKTLVNPTEKQQVKKIAGKELKFTNLHKMYWPKEKITKGDMINYYYQVASYMLPYLKDRPQSLNRYPNGINGESFYQKNIAGKFPSWIKTHDYENTTKPGSKKFFVCADEAHLLYMANLGCIEMNPWHSRVSSPDKPDWCVIDLDPDTNPFDQVIEAANVIQQVLSSVGVACYPKTSGSTGIHIYIPLGAKYEYEQSKTLAHLIVSLAHREMEKFTSLERTPAKRKGKIYLDFLQNRSIQTIAAPYSLRPKPGATVSMPLSWDEVKPGLKISNFTIYNAAAMVKDRDPLFKPVLGKGINIQSVIKKIEKL